MTQLELADKMGVTDKAVSKWERDLSIPDMNSITRLAEIFEVSVDELMQNKVEDKENNIENNKVSEIVDIALKGVGLAMGIAVTVLTVLNEIDMKSAVMMLGIGLASTSIYLLKNK